MERGVLNRELWGHSDGDGPEGSLGKAVAGGGVGSAKAPRQ